jgi:uncharacterized protein YcfJ
MNVKGYLVIGAALGIIAAGPALADSRHSRGAYARVVAVEPIVHRVVVQQPRRECWEDVGYRSAAPGRVAGTTLAGGIVGAAIGRQFGSGRSRDTLTVLGALAGSVVANERVQRNLARRSDRGQIAVPVQRCATTVDLVTEEHIRGYWVTYRYRGRTERVRTLEHPGNRIALHVIARPFRYY